MGASLMEPESCNLQEMEQGPSCITGLYLELFPT